MAAVGRPEAYADLPHADRDSPPSQVGPRLHPSTPAVGLQPHLISKPVAARQGAHLVANATISTTTRPVSPVSAPFQKRLAPFRAALSRRRLQMHSRRQPRPVDSTSWVSWRASSRPVASHDRRSSHSTSRASAGGIHDGAARSTPCPFFKKRCVYRGVFERRDAALTADEVAQNAAVC
jgi:hypothetical protein